MTQTQNSSFRRLAMSAQQMVWSVGLHGKALPVVDVSLVSPMQQASL